jgi:diadenosine tetraphosphatase ApaH/serine/threonine PP2A family protein phosphatase
MDLADILSTVSIHMDRPLSDILRVIFTGYEPFFSLLPEEIPLIGSLIPLPFVPLALIQPLISEVHETLRRTAPLIEVTAPCYIIGDIHGNIHDLMRIFASIPEPLTHQYVFLGDYVDRGDYSIEVCILLLTLFLLHPGQFRLLRGNHEFASVNGQYGFRDEVVEHYGDASLWELIDKFVFQFLPLGALISGHSLCLHAGIGPGIGSLDVIRSIVLPLPRYDEDENVTWIVWADPRDGVPLFGPSARGIGGVFGSQAIDNFLIANRLKYLIRGHECIQHGIASFANKCLTVFSSADYMNSLNAAGFLLIEDSGELRQQILQPMEHVHRADAKYVTVHLRKKKSATEQAFGRGLGVLCVHSSWKGLIPPRSRKRPDPDAHRDPGAGSVAGVRQLTKPHSLPSLPHG